MAKTKDILSKVWMRRGADGVLSRRLCGGRIVEHLPTEQPVVTNRQVDMLVRNDRREIYHVEFQATNDAELPWRMLEYWIYLRRKLLQPVKQCVFYIGSDALRMPGMLEDGGTVHRFDVVSLQDYEAGELLASGDWGDNLWSLGARGNHKEALQAILLKLRAMPVAERESGLAELTAFSTILKLDGLLSEKLKEIPMLDIDLRQNAVVRPWIEEAERQGRKEQLVSQILEKFGTLPDWVGKKVNGASAEQLDLWARRILRANTLEETFE